MPDHQSTNYSEEQGLYINFVEKCDTKLMATAGSGKTFCIIQRIKNLSTQKVYNPNGIFMLTFSKNAKEDFITKLKKNKVDEVPLKNIHTIDSFAWAILGENVSKTIDVSILSYTLLQLLKEIIDAENIMYERIKTPLSKLFNIDCEIVKNKLHHIECIFVDEAQDLNEIQYNILLCLKQISQANIHFVGDPNQNIYQFRNSSDKFLVDYQAHTFYLTKNYRSQSHIVDFCSNLRPYNTIQLNYENERAHPNLDVTFYSYHNTQSFENYIISILHFFKAKNIPLHKIAILAPTRGYLKTVKGVTKYRGLCYIANLLFKHEIPFQQFYNDMSSNSIQSSDHGGDHNEDSQIPHVDGSKITYKVKKNHINLMTYTASKGLEWDYVIIIDANAHLITRQNYDIQKYNAEKYLLYVACSRPRKNLIIFTKHRYTNPWFKDVPLDKYRLARICEGDLEFYDTSLLFQTQDQSLTQPSSNNINVKQNISKMINSLKEDELFEINNILTPFISKKQYNLVDINNICRDNVSDVKDKNEKKIKIKIPENRQGFGSKFLQHLFNVYLFKNNLLETNILRDLQNIINSKNILYCGNEFIITWYFSNRDHMNWETYDNIKQDLHPKIMEYVDSRFDRSQTFSSYTLVDKFYDAFICSNYEKIKNQFEIYLKDPFQYTNILFVSLVSYAVESTHYFYILQDNIFYEDIVAKNVESLHHLTWIIRDKISNKATNHNMKIEYKNIVLFKDFDYKYSFHRNKIDQFITTKIKPLGDEKLKDILSSIFTVDVFDYNDEQNEKKIEFLSFLLSIGKYSHWSLSIPADNLNKVKEIILQKI